MTKQSFRSGAGNQVAAAAMVFENPELAKSRTHFKMRGSDGQIQTSTYLVWTEQGRKFIHQLAHTMWELAKVVNNAE